MKFWRQCYLSLVVIMAGLLVLPVQASQLISLGTGGVTGVYYPTGGALCRLVNFNRQQHGIRCAVRSTLGSVSNIRQVLDGELDVGIAEAGQLYTAGKADSVHVDDLQLRVLLNLFTEYVTIIAKSDANINDLRDLKGKRVNIGKVGSSQRQTFEQLMEMRHWTLADFSEIHFLEPAEQAQALCDNQIDATLYVVAHPSGSIKEALRDCNAKLISLSAKDIAGFIDDNPYYHKVKIAAGVYEGVSQDIETVGVTAALFSRNDLPSNTAYSIVKSLFEQFAQFKQMHPAFESLDIKHIISRPPVLPLHEGSVRYFKEAGLSLVD